MKTLILNADDLGMTRGINDAIIRAHREGILTSATLMATGLEFDDAVAKVKATPALDIGCHVVLTGGVAVTPGKEIPSLADENGHLPASLGALVARVTSGAIRVEEIEIEIRAQIEKIRHAGIEPTHVDTHKHTHAHPWVMNALGRVARELNIPRVRRPIESLRDSWESTRYASRSLAQLAAAAAVTVVSRSFNSATRRYGLVAPDHFLGLALTGQLGPEVLPRLIGLVREGSTEIMLHPGYCDAAVKSAGGRLQEQRQTELDGLLAPASKRAVAQAGIRLITYRDLQ